MITHLEVQNFKSIKDLRLECKRINLFIGGPNTGKSNILESIGLSSSFTYGRLSDFVRFESMSNLFYDENLENVIRISLDEKILEIKFEDSRFKGLCRKNEKEILKVDYDYSGLLSSSSRSGKLSPPKFYKFMVRKNFSRKEHGFLLPPSGKNLLTVLMTNKELKSLVNQIFVPFELRLVLRPQENAIEVQKQLDDIIISYPYSLVSETLQKIVFCLAVIESNKDSVLIFEEPGSHAFPYYTKYLAEIIALERNKNQYFISTHNPYFLLSVLEKSPKDEIGIFLTYYKGNQTRVKSLSEKELQEVLDMGIDLFFNIERFIEGD